MINARPGYWDMASCSWVGAEPMHVVPAVLRSQSASPEEQDRPEAEVPAPRHRRDETAEATASPAS